MSELITGDSFARVIADTSEHGLAVGTVVAVDRVRSQEEPLTGRVRHIAIVQPGGLAVYIDDLEPFDPLAPTPDSPIVVNGQVVTGEAPAAADALVADPEFAATMAALEALFTGDPERTTEPTIHLAGDALPDGQEAARPRGGGTAVNEVQSQPTNPDTPDTGREDALPLEPGDMLPGVDVFGDPMQITYRRYDCPNHGLETYLSIVAPKGYLMKMSDMPILLDYLHSIKAKDDEQKRNARRNGK